MTLLIPYTDCGRDGYELRYAIRSMVKYGNITGCLVIGHKPTWYTGEHIPWLDKPGRKEWSIVSKVCLCPYEEVIYSHDDIFAMQPFINPVYHSGPLKDTVKEGGYPERIRNTMTLYPDGLHYDCHTPMYIITRLYREAHSKCEWEKREYLSKSVYGNMMGGGLYLPDHKMRTIIDKVPEGRPFFSTMGFIARKMNLPALYPEASPYEAK